MYLADDIERKYDHYEKSFFIIGIKYCFLKDKLKSDSKKGEFSMSNELCHAMNNLESHFDTNIRTLISILGGLAGCD